MVQYTFSRKLDQDFSNTLRKRVNAYFKDEGLQRGANGIMVIKSILIIAAFLAIYFVVLFGGITNTWLMFGLWGLMGLVTTIIGTSVMHDGLHGSFSRNKSINALVGASSRILGIAPEVWHMQHNVLHHTYTNIDHADEDIEYRYVLRFSPFQPKKWFHRYQHIYALFFYGISSVLWVLRKDFVKPFHFQKIGLIKTQKEFNRLYARIIAWKVFYYAYYLAVPIYVLPFPAWMVVLMFLVSHFITGVSMTLIFQSAHVVPAANFVEQEEKEVNENWSVHQLKTTANFASNNKWLTWIIGGLNHQVEHHLFPNVCHVHYPQISRIVKETAEEYNLPYHNQSTFAVAILNHFKMLRNLGQ